MNTIRTWLTNNFVFNNPVFDYKKTNLNSKSIIFIKKKKDNINDNNDHYIPCLFIQEREQSSKFLIFFHGNSEDIFISELIGQYFSEKLQVNVIIVEYPGYSIYNEAKSAETMCYDSLEVYDFIKLNFNLTDDDIFILGRSIGTGPAIYLSHLRRPKGLILISPFKSIKSIKGPLIGFFLLDIFKSIDIINKVTTPVLFIHGKNDHLIDCSHSEELLEKLDNFQDLKDLNKNKIFLNDNMTHNDMDLDKDIIDRILQFFKNNEFIPKKGHFNYMDKNFKKLFDTPLEVQKNLLSLNLNLDNPSILNINSRYSIILRDERIAFALDNYQIDIYDSEEMEKELTIKTEDVGLINYLFQLYNGIFVANSDFSVAFYSLKKYKCEQLKLMKFNNSIIVKIDQFNNDKILILTNKALIIFDNEYKLVKKYESSFINMKVVTPYISFQSQKKVIIYKLDLEKNEINKKNEFILTEPIINDKLINIDNKILCFHDCNGLNFYSFDNCQIYLYKDIFIRSPNFIFSLYKNIIVIGNENGDIQVLEIKAINNLKSVLYKENKLKIGNNSITSILGLKDGKLVISKKENEKIEMIGNENICPENCIII